LLPGSATNILQKDFLTKHVEHEPQRLSGLKNKNSFLHRTFASKIYMQEIRPPITARIQVGFQVVAALEP
jgi:hypothetical protein